MDMFDDNKVIVLFMEETQMPMVASFIEYLSGGEDDEELNWVLKTITHKEVMIAFDNEGEIVGLIIWDLQEPQDAITVIDAERRDSETIAIEMAGAFLEYLCLFDSSSY